MSIFIFAYCMISLAFFMLLMKHHMANKVSGPQVVVGCLLWPLTLYVIFWVFLGD